MDTHTFSANRKEYTVLYKDGDWGIVRYEEYPNVGIYHKCINDTGTKQVNRISHMFVRNSSNYTCTYCYRKLPEGVYALWSMMNWDCDGDLLVTPYDFGTIKTLIQK